MPSQDPNFYPNFGKWPKFTPIFRSAARDTLCVIGAKICEKFARLAALLSIFCFRALLRAVVAGERRARPPKGGGPGSKNCPDFIQRGGRGLPATQFLSKLWTWLTPIFEVVFIQIADEASAFLANFYPNTAVAL